MLGYVLNLGLVLVKFTLSKYKKGTWVADKTALLNHKVSFFRIHSCKLVGWLPFSCLKLAPHKIYKIEAKANVLPAYNADGSIGFRLYAGYFEKRLKFNNSNKVFVNVDDENFQDNLSFGTIIDSPQSIEFSWEYGLIFQILLFIKAM